MVAQLPMVSDSLSLYLAEIRKFPVLNEEDDLTPEEFFSRRYEPAQSLVDSIKAPTLAEEPAVGAPVVIPVTEEKDVLLPLPKTPLKDTPPEA